ncbi:MAG: MHS family MFS transporter [Cyclobacteriaceae bacterium]|nr:MHS family MFS transporter [Cyclobacteriaceae bacterium]
MKKDPEILDKHNLWFVITASSVGTLIEWYDFYIFGSLATILSEQFFPKTNPTVGLLSTLATFAVGFIVRPFGAIVFGRLGDMVGRKYTFLVTLILMGCSTFGIGLVPGYETIGIAAPLLVLLLRVIQGLALGGEYGGAATYVAEHAPLGKRGFYTSFIQTTATLGLFVSLGVILAVRQSLGVAEFSAWGWRIPFLLSAALVAISVYIRLRMQESPLYSKIKREGATSKNPILESFGKKKNLKIVLLALFGATAGQGVVWYTGQFYALTFLQKTCNLEFVQSYSVIAIALVLGTPLFIVFGRLSDTIGRKYIMMAGMLLAAVSYRPIYQAMYDLTDLKQKIAIEEGKNIHRETSPETGVVNITSVQPFADGTDLIERFTVNDDGSISPPKKEIKLADQGFWIMIGLILIQVVYVTMVYGPIAAFLVELFPTRIRYTSMSLPYHIGNGVFGGLTPLIATWMSGSGDILVGLWYPIVVASVCFVIGMVFLSNKTPEEVD